MLDIDKIEKALLQIFAGIANLQPGTNIFYGQIPENMMDATAVITAGDASGNEPEIPKFTIQIIGKFTLRKDAAETFSLISQSLPMYGSRIIRVDGYDVLIEAILKRGNGGVYPEVENGCKTWRFSLNAVACVKSINITGA